MKEARVRRLVEEIEGLEYYADQLARKKQALEKIRLECDHDWSPTECKSKHHPAYTIPGDPQGTMGSDHRGLTHVDAKTEVWWTRTCLKCGEEEGTTKSKPTGSEPVFPS